MLHGILVDLLLSSRPRILICGVETGLAGIIKVHEYLAAKLLELAVETTIVLL